MNLLSTALRGLPEYRSLLRSVETSDAAAVTGLSSIHRAHLIAALRSDTGRPILAVCQDDLAAARMAEELSGFLGEKPPVFPARESLHHAPVCSCGLCHSPGRGRQL